MENGIPSREQSHIPLKNGILKMIFLFPKVGYVSIPWRVTSTQVATAALNPGEVILRERPLLGLPDSFDTDLDLLLNQTSLSHWDRSVLFFQGS